MNSLKHCPICDHESVRIRDYSRDMQHKGVTLSVDGLQCSDCRNCGSEFATPDQLDANANKIRAAFIAERARVKHEQGLLAGTEIRCIRERFHLTQKQAAKVFGGGSNAFAKYEAEDVVQSVGMDKLLRLAVEVPNAAAWLFRQSGIDFSQIKLLKPHHGAYVLDDLEMNKWLVAEIKIPDFFTENKKCMFGKFSLSHTTYHSNDGSYTDAA